MKENYVKLQVSDGSEMNAYVARPQGEAKGGVIVFQEAFGVNDYIRGVADRIAKEGYVVIAPELFHRTEPGFERVDAGMDEIAQHYQAVTVEGVEADARAAHEWLTKEVGDNVGAIGFCMGGRATYIATSILPFKGTISLYGGGIAPDLLDRVPNLSAPMLFFWGGVDARIPRELWSQIPAAMDKAGKWHMDVEIAEAPHAYLTDDRPGYNKTAAELTWPLIIAFFKQKLG